MRKSQSTAFNLVFEDILAPPQLIGGGGAFCSGLATFRLVLANDQQSKILTPPMSENWYMDSCLRGSCKQQLSPEKSCWQNTQFQLSQGITWMKKKDACVERIWQSLLLNQMSRFLLHSKCVHYLRAWNRCQNCKQHVGRIKYPLVLSPS